MKTVLMISPNAVDGVSIYRHWGPMIDLEKRSFVKLITLPDDSRQISNWQYFRKADFCFLNRSSRIVDKAIIEECYKFGVPMWQDIDDNVFELPKDNPAYEWWGENSNAILLQGLRLAKLVTVATPRLQIYLKEKFGIDSWVVPNALHDSDWKRFQKPFTGNERTVWRGSPAGARDLAFYSDAIDWPAHYMGFNPYWMKGNYSSENPKNYVDYLISLCNVNPSFIFMTHLDNEFHRTKSTNGWLEATMAGAVCLMPDISEWVQRPGFHYKVLNLESFKYQAEKMFKSSHNKLREIHQESVKIIENNYLLSEVNKHRMSLIEKFFN
jgi:hypothetical protein